MALDREILAERTSALERHLKRVSDRLPRNPSDFIHGSDVSDAVILHLWQAVQLTIYTALSACVALHLGTPSSYAAAFFKLREANYLDGDLAVRLAHAAGFRNRIVHAYEELDMQKIYKIACKGPDDLRACFAAVRNMLDK